MEDLEEKKKEYKKAIDKPEARFDINPIILTKERKLILARRILNDEEGGKWSFPGGKVFQGEFIRESLIKG